jgi:orotidine-5'-phosphate decarboxylase
MADLTSPSPATGRPRSGRAEVIVALDYPSLDDALGMVERLGPLCRFYKVGLELFTAAGPRALRELRSRGCDVFLDLKLHDIPNTVRGAARSAASLGARLLTVHASGGAAMMAAAVAGAGEGCGILAVTVLTSLDGGALADAWGRTRGVTVGEEVIRLADHARAAGVHGLVCAGTEVAPLRARHGDDLRLLVPGLRLPGAEVGGDDQARVASPADAAAAGASYLVLGRAVTRAADPEAAMASVLESIGG